MNIPFRPFLGRIKRAVIPHRIPDKTLRHSLFRGGFLCHATADRITGNDEWRHVSALWSRMEVGEFTLLTHPETPIARVSAPGRETVLLGHAFYIGPKGSEADPIAIFDAASLDEIPAALDRISGRFALIVIRDGKARFFHDQLPARSVYYRENGAFGVASHDEIFALAFGDGRRADISEFVNTRWFRAFSMAYLPGGSTVQAGVRALTGNLAYDAATRRPVRYWPTEPLNRDGTFDEFFAAIDDWYRGLMGYIGDRPVVISVTGGIDSRTIAAAATHYGIPFTTMTWAIGNYADWEREPVEAAVAYLGRPHRWITQRRSVINDVATIGARNSGNFRGVSSIVAGLSRAYGANPSTILLCGHVSPVIRGAYRHNKPPPMSDLSLSELVRLYFLGKPNPDIEPDMERMVRKEIERYAEIANYEAIAGLGYDPNDIYYWEHKATLWASASYNNLDAAILCLPGFNGRRVAKAAFAMPDAERLSKTLFHNVIKRYDPGLAEIYYK